MTRRARDHITSLSDADAKLLLLEVAPLLDRLITALSSAKIVTGAFSGIFNLRQDHLERCASVDTAWIDGYAFLRRLEGETPDA